MNKLIFKIRFVFCIFILFIFSITCFSQDLKKNEFLVKFGYYDAVSVGYQHEFFTNISVGISIGSNFRLYNNQEYYNIDFFANWKIGEGTKWKLLSNIYLGLNIHNVFIEDSYYKWDFLAFVPSIGKKIFLGNKFGLIIEGGPAFNIVLYNKRKSDENVGWPYHILGDFKVTYFICF